MTSNGSFEGETNIILIQTKRVPGKGDHHCELTGVRGWMHRSVERVLDLSRQSHPRAKVQAQGDGGMHRHGEDNQQGEQPAPERVVRSNVKTHGQVG